MLTYIEEIERVKRLYRPVVDLDNNGKIIESDYKKADEALDNLLLSTYNHALEEAMKCLPDKKDWEPISSLSTCLLSTGLKVGWNGCRQEVLEAIEKLKQ